MGVFGGPLLGIFFLGVLSRRANGHGALAGAGARGSLIATTKRSDGRVQVTYAGRRLYYYVGDRKPRQVLCQNVNEFGGLWLVIRPNGKLVR